MMKTWLRNDIKSLKLIYRATRDNCTHEKFHELVNDKKPPLLLMIQSNKFGTIGVYTSIKQRKGEAGDYELDKELFHFNLRSGIKYYPKEYNFNNVE